MKTRFWRITWLALLMTCVHVASADPGVRMHRQQAGEFNLDSWSIAQSTEGQFSVRMPGRFNDFTVDSEPKDELARTFVVGGLDIQGVAFTAMRLEYRGGGKVARRYFDNYRDGSPFGATMTSRHNLVYEGHEAVQMTVDTGKSWFITRAVTVEPDLLILIVEAKDGDRKKAGPYAERFFATLKVSTR